MPRRFVVALAVMLGCTERAAPPERRHVTLDLDAVVAGQRRTVRVEPQGWTYAGLLLAPSSVSPGGQAGWPPTREPGGAYVARGEGFVERVAQQGDRVEQSWTFARRPAAGALTVRVPVSGKLEQADARGLRFAGAVRYGHATWVDAAGERIKVPARFEAGQIVLTVPPEVVARSRYPAVLDPILSVEQPIDAPLYSPAAGVDSHPAAAFDGVNYLVVWDDVITGTNIGVVHGIRVAPDGTTVDPGAFPILGNAAGTTGQGPTSSPELSFDGTNFLVVGLMDSPGTCTPGQRIVLVRRFVSTQGVALGSPVAVPSTVCPDIGHPPRVVFGATTFLVAYGRTFGSPARTDVQAYTVSQAGTATPVPALTADTSTHDSAAVDFDGLNFLVVWQDSRSVASSGIDIYARRVSQAGVPQDVEAAAVTFAPGDQTRPAVDFLINHLVAWEDTRGGDPDIYAQAMTPIGVVLVAGDRPVATPASTEAAPQVLVLGGDFAVAWSTGTTNRDIAYRGLDIMGALIGAADVPITTGGSDQSEVGLATDGNRMLFVWREQTGTTASSEIRGVRLMPPSTLLDPTSRIFSMRANAELAPATAFNGTHHLVAWADDRDAGVPRATRIVAARLGADGGTVDVPALNVTPGIGLRLPPSAASDGTNWLVTWGEQGAVPGEFRVAARRVSSAGALLDAQPFYVPANTAAAVTSVRPAVAFDGTNWVVAWTNASVNASRVSRTGQIVDITPLTVAPYAAPAKPAGLAAVSGGSQTLLVWNHGATSQTHGRRVSAGGSVLDAADLIIGGAGGSRNAPTADFDGTAFLVAWADDTATPNGLRISYVTPTGGTGAAFAVGTGPVDNPAVAWDGWNHVLAFESYVTGMVNRDVRVEWLKADGGVLTAPVALATSTDLETLPALSVTPRGDALIAYQVLDSATGVNAERVRYRTVSQGKLLGVACMQATECTTGFCVDGVCCESVCGGGVLDCQVCSAALGSTRDGTCAPSPAATLCRNATLACDSVERCDGVARACPADAVKPNTEVCRPVAGLCDVEEKCDGTGMSCPADIFAPLGTACRPIVGPCDRGAEVCGGASAQCPPDSFENGKVCRFSAGPCDIQEMCDGVAGVCPLEQFQPQGTLCRSPMSTCDEPEVCSGSGSDCPPDLGCPATGGGAGGGGGTGGGAGGGAGGGGGMMPKGCGCGLTLEPGLLLALAALKRARSRR